MTASSETPFQISMVKDDQITCLSFLMYDTQDSNALLLNNYIDFYGLILNLIQGTDFNRSCELDGCERLKTPQRNEKTH